MSDGWSLGASLTPDTRGNCVTLQDLLPARLEASIYLMLVMNLCQRFVFQLPANH
jgi:hypothetical protein